MIFLEKTITIDGKQILFKVNGSTPLRYKAQFGKDYFKEIMKLAPLEKFGTKKFNQNDLDSLDFDVFYNMAWIMAKTANPSIPDPIEWLDGFEEFPITEILPELQELLIACFKSSKKK